MPRRNSKARPVERTNPKAGTNLPSKRGTFSPSVAPVDPIRPKTITRHQQIKPGPSVVVTGKASNLTNEA